MVRHRGHGGWGAISGLLWGAGLAVVVQQFGLWYFDPFLVIGAPLGAAVLSGLWGRRRNRGAAVALLVLLPPVVLAQGTCEVWIDGDPLHDSSAFDPVVIDRDMESVDVEGQVPGGPPTEGEVWVEFAGLRIGSRSFAVSEDGQFFRTIDRDDLGFLDAPGLYRVGGEVQGRCTGAGFVRIEGTPFDNPVGVAGLGAIGLGLLGTWFAGRRPRVTTGRGPEKSVPQRAGEAEPGRPTVTGPVLASPGRIEATVTLAGEAPSPLSSFVAGASHEIRVRLGAPDAEWRRRVTASPTSRRRLRLALFETMASPAPQFAGVDQPGGGVSTTATFNLEVPAGAGMVFPRIVALDGNRIVQTATLPTRITMAPDAAAPAAADIATAETTVYAHDVAAGGGRAIDAAFLVNHSAGRPLVTAIAGEDGALVDIGEGSAAEAVAKIRGRLGEIVEAPADFASLDAPGSVELLVFLAHHGRILRNALVADFLGDALAGSASIQVVSATPDAYFPFEFAYDFAAPQENATLCPTAAATLASADPTRPCPAEHDETVVCPTGFWGLSKVIERHAHQPGETLPVGFLLRSRPTTDRGALPLGDVLYAASDRVDAIEPGSIERVSARLDEVTGHHSVQAKKWDEWIADVGDRPAVLLLLPHTVYSETLGVYGLEIGTGDRRWAGDIDARFVPPDDRPVVTLLLGCETAAAGDVAYERFPALFRRAGGEIVLGTLTEILGRHAAPVAEELVEAIFAAAEAPAAFGEVMLAARRRLVGRGLLMVLAVTAYGDADWLLTPPVDV